MQKCARTHDVVGSGGRWPPVLRPRRVQAPLSWHCGHLHAHWTFSSGSNPLQQRPDSHSPTSGHSYPEQLQRPAPSFPIFPVCLWSRRHKCRSSAASEGLPAALKAPRACPANCKHREVLKYRLSSPWEITLRKGNWFLIVNCFNLELKVKTVSFAHGRWIRTGIEYIYKLHLQERWDMWKTQY